MAWINAFNFVIQELKDGSTFPVEYDVNAGSSGGRVYRVTIIPPPSVVILDGIRKRAGVGDIETINFAPTGGCPYCGR